MPSNASAPRYGFILFMGIALPAFQIGCSSVRDEAPPIQTLYNEAAQDEIRNPVIVIHGILGARLSQRSTGRVVWGAFTDDAVAPRTPEGARAIALPLKIPETAFYDPASEEVFAAGPLDRLDIQLTFPVLSVNIYRDIIRTLGAGGYTDSVVRYGQTPAYADDHFTCYTFFYDWRRDNVSNALLLHSFIQEKRREIQRTATAKIRRLREAGDADSLHQARRWEDWLEQGYKFDIVAHSMGGLLARYYLRYGNADLPADGSLPPLTWAGAEEIDRLLMVGTPNLGAMESLNNLCNGQRLVAILPFYHQALLGTFPSIYQLLPRTRHNVYTAATNQTGYLDVFDVDVWEANGWGLMDPSSDAIIGQLLPGVAEPGQRRRIARSYLAWCLSRAEQFHRALDQVPERSCPSEVYLFAGDVKATLSRVVLREEGNQLVPDFGADGLHTPGDGTVPRYSALADERFGEPYRRGLRTPVPWTNVTFLSDNHLGLTSNPHFFNNTLFILLDHWDLN